MLVILMALPFINLIHRLLPRTLSYSDHQFGFHNAQRTAVLH